LGNHLFDAIRGAMPQPDRAFAIAEGTTWTYGNLLKQTAMLANRLRELGVAPGDRVAAQIDKSIYGLFLYLACVRAGAVYLPLNSDYTLAELDYFIGDAEPKVFVATPATASQLEPMLARHGGRVVTLATDGSGTLREGLDDASFEDVERGPDDLAAILYTSGTTGRSKGAMLSHDNLLSNALVLKDYWRFTDADRLIHALPIFHTHGLFVATNTVLVSGASMLLLAKFDADRIIDLMAEATVLMGVPTYYVRLSQHPKLTPQAASHMRLFVSGSAPLLAETHDAFRKRSGQAILERYGMTETNMNTSNPYEGDRIAGTVGFPLPGVDLRIVDPESGTPVPAGSIGMIEVKGPNVFKGYWRMPEKTAQEFRPDGFFITGDLGSRDERGYVTIVGRGKDLVITGGYNVYPKEIEMEIDAIDGVVESAVFGVPHPDFGEGVTAAVVRDAKATVDEAAITARLTERLAAFKRPKRIIFLDELPRNTMAKVQKNVLRTTYQDLYKI
jgi:malonyl-CoA/methylmalonyl-CoA synthetase